MTDNALPDQWEGVTELVGYREAAAYLGLARNTLSSYVSRGIGPAEKQDAEGKPERRIVGQYLFPVFEREELDRWKQSRPGQGHRSDLVSAVADAA
jgi:hypothetical protein